MFSLSKISYTKQFGSLLKENVPRHYASRATSKAVVSEFPSLQEAIKVLKAYEVGYTNHTIDIHVNCSPGKGQHQIRGNVLLPHSLNKKSTLLVFAEGKQAEEAREAGADIVGLSDVIEKIKKGELEFDKTLATPDVLPEVAKIARIIGPKGLMPTVNKGTVVTDIKSAVTYSKRALDFTADPHFVIHTAVGRVTFTDEQLEAINLNQISLPLMQAHTEQSSITVVLRCKPENTKDSSAQSVENVFCKVNDNKITFKLTQKPVSLGGFNNINNRADSSRQFYFDHIFFPQKSISAQEQQQLIYDSVGNKLLKHALEGYNICIFAYGQTGSGKTYTMSGTEENPGLIPRLCNDLFFQLHQLHSVDISSKALHPKPGRLNYHIQISYYQIYNEKVYDLLSTNNSLALRVREHPTMGPYIEGLTYIPVSSFSEISSLLLAGNKNRITSFTKFNDHSSRSHAIFTIKLSQKKFSTERNSSTEIESKISLVDLAGSEKATLASKNKKSIKEGISINKSLSTLSIVTSALANNTTENNKSFVPYRDSTLTWLLKDSLGGNSRTAIIATVSPTISQDTLGTLQYAERAKKIVNHAVINKDLNAPLIDQLRDEIKYLKNQLVNLNKSLKEKYEKSESSETSQLSEDLPLKSEDYMDFINQPLKLPLDPKQYLRQEEILYEKIVENENLIREFCKPWEMRLKKNRTMLNIDPNINYNQRRHNFDDPLKYTNLNSENTGFLVRLYQSSQADSSKICTLKQGITTIGGTLCEDADIKFDLKESLISSRGSKYCILYNDGVSGVIIYAIKKNIIVNKQIVSDPLILPNNCTIEFGFNSVFKFIYNKKENIAINSATIESENLLNGFGKVGERNTRLDSFNLNQPFLRRSNSLPCLDKLNDEQGSVSSKQTFNIEDLDIATFRQNPRLFRSNSTTFNNDILLDSFKLNSSSTDSTSFSRPQSECNSDRGVSFLKSRFIKAVKSVIKAKTKSKFLSVAKLLLTCALYLKKANIFSTILGINVSYEFCIYSSNDLLFESSYMEEDGFFNGNLIDDGFFKQSLNVQKTRNCSICSNFDSESYHDTGCGTNPDHNSSPSPSSSLDSSLHSDNTLKLGVKVFDLINKSIYYWTLDLFLQKLKAMEKIYQYSYNPNYKIHMDYQSSFIDSRNLKYSLVGMADIPIINISEYIQSLDTSDVSNLHVEYPVTTRLTDPISSSLSKLKINCIVRIKRKYAVFETDGSSKESPQNTVEVIVASIHGFEEKLIQDLHLQIKAPDQFKPLNCRCIGDTLCGICARNLYYPIDINIVKKNSKYLYDSSKIFNNDPQAFTEYKSRSIRMKRSVAEKTISPVVTHALAFSGNKSIAKRAPFLDKSVESTDNDSNSSKDLDFNENESITNYSTFQIFEKFKFQKSQKNEKSRGTNLSSNYFIAKAKFDWTPQSDCGEYLKISIFGKLPITFIERSKESLYSQRSEFQPNKLHSTGERAHEKAWLTPKTHDLVMHVNIFEMFSNGSWGKVPVAIAKNSQLPYFPSANIVEPSSENSPNFLNQLFASPKKSLDSKIIFDEFGSTKEPTLNQATLVKRSSLDSEFSRFAKNIIMNNSKNSTPPPSASKKKNSLAVQSSPKLPPISFRESVNYFMLRQGSQKRAQISISHNSGAELDFEIKQVSFNDPIAIDSNGKRITDCQNSKSFYDFNGIKQKYQKKVKLREINQDKIKTVFNNRSYCCFSGVWDSSLHSSEFLDTVTQDYNVVQVKVQVTLKVKGVEDEVVLESPIYMLIVDRNIEFSEIGSPISFNHSQKNKRGSVISILSKNQPVLTSELNTLRQTGDRANQNNSPMTKEENLGSELSKYLSFVSFCYQVRFSPVSNEINLRENLWRYDYNGVYVRGEELLHFHKFSNLDMLYQAEKLYQKQNYTSEVNSYKAKMFISFHLKKPRAVIQKPRGYFSYAEQFVKRLFMYSESNKVEKLSIEKENDGKGSNTASNLALSKSEHFSCPYFLSKINYIQVQKSSTCCQSGYLKTPDTTLKIWPTKWVVVQRPFLFIFTNKSTRTLENMVNIVSARVDNNQHLAGATGKKWVFAIYTETSTFLFQAESESKLLMWINSIDDVFLKIPSMNGSTCLY
ncbi:hypothetical protein BB560_002903 [Smittium megazygosporum]|uniref:Uncharacterized protein n=1 Tax=Smittium megazygosporum TaxID=133381 RepID=A0A2T9ZDM2_9FUNG|nr:hypothetical protein BB560_002903 [Smittium megazygosporum]